MAEAFNAAGNLAFKSGDYQTASALYSQAVEVDGKVAKYHTNLCNALLKRGKLFEAILQAAAATTADSSWVKGYYYKALALEQALKLPEALAACQEGLHIHRCEACPWTQQQNSVHLCISCSYVGKKCLQHHSRDCLHNACTCSSSLSMWQQEAHS
jgi:tetratricopeptide (TPR) repeat protein